MRLFKARKKGRGKKLGDVKNLKARLRICLLDAFVVGGYILVRDVLLPILESIDNANNVALGILRYLLEWSRQLLKTCCIMTWC